jgi:hypothetical protein
VLARALVALQRSILMRQERVPQCVMFPLLIKLPGSIIDMTLHFPVRQLFREARLNSFK